MINKRLISVLAMFTSFPIYASVTIDTTAPQYKNHALIGHDETYNGTGVFTAIPVDDIIPRVECAIEYMSCKWTLSRADEGAYVSPDDALLMSVML